MRVPPCATNPSRLFTDSPCLVDGGYDVFGDGERGCRGGDQRIAQQHDAVADADPEVVDHAPSASRPARGFRLAGTTSSSLFQSLGAGGGDEPPLLNDPSSPIPCASVTGESPECLSACG